jgi:hypothetical protein
MELACQTGTVAGTSFRGPDGLPELLHRGTDITKIELSEPQQSMAGPGGLGPVPPRTVVSTLGVLRFAQIAPRSTSFAQCWPPI